MTARINPRRVCAGTGQPAAPAYDPLTRAVHPILLLESWGGTRLGDGHLRADAKEWTLSPQKAPCDSQLVLCFDVTNPSIKPCYYEKGGKVELHSAGGTYRVVEARSAKVIVEGRFQTDLQCPLHMNFRAGEREITVRGGSPLDDEKAFAAIEAVVDTTTAGRRTPGRKRK